jgi:hypothetical protein
VFTPLHRDVRIEQLLVNHRVPNILIEIKSLEDRFFSLFFFLVASNVSIFTGTTSSPKCENWGELPSRLFDCGLPSNIINLLLQTVTPQLRYSCMLLSVSYSVDIRISKALHPARTALQASKSVEFYPHSCFLHSFSRTLHNVNQFDRLASTLWITNAPVISSPVIFNSYICCSYRSRMKCRVLANARTSLRSLNRWSLFIDQPCLFFSAEAFYLLHLRSDGPVILVTTKKITCSINDSSMMLPSLLVHTMTYVAQSSIHRCFYCGVPRYARLSSQGNSAVEGRARPISCIGVSRAECTNYVKCQILCVDG